MTQSLKVFGLLLLFPLVSKSQSTEPKIGAERPFRRSFAELGSIYAVRSLIYANTGALQDNDFSSWKVGFKERFRSKTPYRFDDNSLAINHFGHALLPGYETALFRSNGMSFSQSFALQFSASTIWEFVVEARETVSLNDVLVTPVAGATISESFYQYSQFFRRSKPTTFNRVAGIVFTGPMAFNYWVNGEKRTPSGEYDEHGFDRNQDHIFRDYLSAAVLSKGGAQWDFGHEMKLNEGYGIIAVGYYSGADKRKFSKPASTEIGFRINGGTSVNEVGAYEHVMFIGRSRSTYHLRDEKITGSAMLYGLSSGYSLYNANFDGFHDNIIALHILGPAIDWNKNCGKAWLQLNAKLYADFASVYSTAFNDYIQEKGIDKNTTKSSLKGQDYYHGIGGSAFIKAKVSRDKFSIGGQSQLSVYNSFEGYERHQEDVTNDFHLSDFRNNSSAWIGYNVKRGWDAQLGFETRQWESRIAGDFVKKNQINSVFGRVVYSY